MSEQRLTKSPEKTMQRIARRESRPPSAPSYHGGLHPILQLQRIIGNHAVERLIQAKRLTPQDKILGLQRKPPVSQPHDPYEQEADHVADQVMRMPGPQLQRACSCGGGCPKCQKEQPVQEDQRLQIKRAQASDAGSIAVPPIVNDVLRSPGQPLDTTATPLAARLGVDTRNVSVHVDAAAARSAAAVQARAFTVGNGIVFGAGQYRPHTADGKWLIAHELAHVAQQLNHAGGAAGVQRVPRGPQGLSRPDDAARGRKRGQATLPELKAYVRSATGRETVPLKKRAYPR